MTNILVINPNSSESITEGLRTSLDLIKPAGATLTYFTGSKAFQCPPSINGALSSVESAIGVFRELSQGDASSSSAAGNKDDGHERAGESLLQTADAILICCFSDHSLAEIIRQEYPMKPCMHILESAVNFALSRTSKPFGIITTGSDMIPDIDRGVLTYLGGLSNRYAGTLATNLGVLELREEKSREKVESILREKIVELGRMGVGAIILGCAGFAGKETFIRACLTESIGRKAASHIALVDGAKAGIHLLAGLSRCELNT
ncbi:hypothetical protein CBS101457_001586 [Exobasidium rhododendri]|nr:hypothetical protein CBS101457_001586 [Exobasidium rhododendri]